MNQIKRFSRDVIWNLLSVVILGICGFSLNVIIGRYYGAEAFGIFSQVLAVYYIFSQLSVGGLTFSSLSLVAKHSQDHEAVRRIVSSALILTAGLAGLVCLIVLFMAGWIGGLLESDGVRQGIYWVLPGLWFFAINKILLMSINGLRHMRFYAVCNSLRYILILVSLIGLALMRVDASVLPLCLSLGEMVLLPLMVIYLFRHHPPQFSGLRPWFGQHLHFGGFSFFSGLLMDINLKVDVMMLGYYLSNRIVGVYSFAAMLAIEGLYQFVVVIQMNMNPLLTRLKTENRMEDLRIYTRRAFMILSPAMAFVSCLIGFLYPYLTVWLTGSDEFVPGRIYFVVLMLGIVIGSSHLPFLFLLNQWGHPGWFSLFLLSLVATNLVLNLLLIPLYGALGAAIGTGLSYVLTGVYLKTFIHLAKKRSLDLVSSR
jgi:O-antigen/teichoic acid export membrane protein